MVRCISSFTINNAFTGGRINAILVLQSTVAISTATYLKQTAISNKTVASLELPLIKNSALSNNIVVPFNNFRLVSRTILLSPSITFVWYLEQYCCPLQ